MSEQDQADAIVLGMGPGGEHAAGLLAEAGWDVVGIDHRLVGGECPYWGCVPTKMMVRASDALAEARRVARLAGDAVVTADWSPVAERIRTDATDNWDDHVAVERFEGKGGRFLRGTGRLAGPGRVEVGDRVIEARRAIVINTGTEPSAPPVPGLDGLPYWTNREAVETTEIPGSLVVLGGGAIGVELAQVFSRFGSSVTVVEAAPQLVPAEEPEVAAVLQPVLEAEGITVHVGAQIVGARQASGRFVLDLGDGNEVSGDRLLVAAGRRANLAALGVASIGIDEKDRWLPVDDHLRVTDGVWAIGDVTGKGAFTHVSMYQAAIAAADILGRPTAPADYKALPRVTFTDPEVGSVGLTQRQATEAGLRLRTGSAEVPRSARGWIHKVGNEGVLKLVEDADRGWLVGATTMGPAGGEVLGLLALAVHAQVPTEQLRRMIFAYPTFHRGIEAALARLHDV